MKQYYQFMLHGVRDGPEEADCNIDSFEEDLQEMLMVRMVGGVSSRPAQLCLCEGFWLVVLLACCSSRFGCGSVAVWP